MRNLLPLFLLAAGANLWAQPDLFFNQGALVHVQANALVYVQGGYVNNDQGVGNDGVTDNYGTIQLVNAAGGWRGNLTNGNAAEFNTYPASWVYMQGDFSNSGAYRAGAPGYGGTIEFNGTDIQTYENTASATEWTLGGVRINNTATVITQQYVEIVAGTAQDMHIRDSLRFIDGRIHTGVHEVRMINKDPNSITRALGPPATPGTFANLVPQNQNQYIYGALRWNVDEAQTYPFIVGGDPAARGLQRIDVAITTPGGGHYVRVRFSGTGLNDITRPPYCRAPDGTNRLYKTLNNGHWIVQPFANISAAAPSADTDLGGVTMHNRVVSNATLNGLCPATGTPGDPFFNNTPSDLCYVGINYNQLTPPDNCQGSNTGFTVNRTGFGSYDVNDTYEYVTVWTNLWPLPSDELRLAAAPAGQAIRLSWDITMPEAEYILGYELYRKTVDGDFTRIAQVDKQGRMQYGHLDQYVAPNTRYFYQVAQHDIFGNVRYSNIVEAILPAKGDAFTAQIQPNPVVSEGSLLATLPSEGALGFVLYDAAGKLVAQNTWMLSAGTHQLDLAPILSQIAAGNYNAHVTFGGDTKVLRLIKTDFGR